MEQELANELAIIKAEFGEMKKVVGLLNNQVAYLVQLSETIVEYGNPCQETKQSGADSLDMLKELLHNSPLKKHPMFADMLKPLEEMLSKQKA